VWFARLEPLSLPQLAAAGLSSDELATARRSGDEHRATSRALLRFVLGRALGHPPHRLHFASGTRGKPFLVTPRSGQNYEFSVSHSQDRGLIALSPTGVTLGVDVEHVTNFDEIEEVAELLLPARARRELRDAPDATLRLDIFYRHWTRLEAVAKLSGTGLGTTAQPRDRFVRITELTPEPGLVAALAVAPTRRRSRSAGAKVSRAQGPLDG